MKRLVLFWSVLVLVFLVALMPAKAKATYDALLAVAAVERITGEWGGVWVEGGLQGTIEIKVDAAERRAYVTLYTEQGESRSSSRVSTTEDGTQYFLHGRTTRTTLTLEEENGHLTLSGTYVYHTGNRAGKTGTIRLEKKK